MNPLFRTFFAVCLFYIACEKAEKPSAVEKTPEYIELQRAAERFSPAVGKYGGELIVSVLSEPTTFNPITSVQHEKEFTRFQYEGLVRIDGVTLKPRPCLATSWDTSADGLVWTFHIRPGVQWSDGSAFSAYDVEFTFNSLIYNDAINPNPSHELFMMNGKKIIVDVIDNLTVRFTLPAPFAPFWAAMSQEILPKHRYAASVRQGTFSKAMSVRTPCDSMPGTGPFCLESYISSQKVTLKRNSLYWQKDSVGNRLPYLDRIVYMIVMERSAELLKFKRGEIDYLTAGGEDFSSLQKDTAKGAYCIHRLGPATGSIFFMFNQNCGFDKKSKKPFVDSIKLSWFRNESFRKAVAYAFDKGRMIQEAMNGRGYPQWSPMSPAEGPFFNPFVVQYPYDTIQARSVLAAAGFKDTNKDEIIEDSLGHPIEFSFITNNGNPLREKLANIIQKNLEKLGFRVHLQVIDFTNMSRKIDEPPFDWEAALISFSGAIEPHCFASVWRSSESRHLWFPSQKSPSTTWEAAIDSIFYTGSRELDESKRKLLYDQWQRIASDKLPFIFTVSPERIACISKKIQNINPSVYGGLLHSVERLFVRSPN